jgi:hypothetical protein
MGQIGCGFSMSLMKRVECVLRKHKNVLLSRTLAMKDAISLSIQLQDFKTSRGWADFKIYTNING